MSDPKDILDWICQHTPIEIMMGEYKSPPPLGVSKARARVDADVPPERPKSDPPEGYRWEYESYVAGHGDIRQRWIAVEDR